MKKLSGVYFCGNKASDYAIENGYLDYATFSKAFDAVLNNDIMTALESAGYYFDQIGGFVDHSEGIETLKEELESLEAGKVYAGDSVYFVDEDGEKITGEAAAEIDSRITEIYDEIADLEADQEDGHEIFQYFIVSNNARDILAWNNEIVFYCESLDMYIWGVTHWGTSWDYVLTDIQLNCGDEAYK